MWFEPGSARPLISRTDVHSLRLATTPRRQRHQCRKTESGNTSKCSVEDDSKQTKCRPDGVETIFPAILRYDTRCYFNVRSKADIGQLNLPHGRCRWWSHLTNGSGNSERTNDSVKRVKTGGAENDGREIAGHEIAGHLYVVSAAL